MGGASVGSHNTTTVQVLEGVPGLVHCSMGNDHVAHVGEFRRWQLRNEFNRARPWKFRNHLAAAINRMCGNR
jgi:hypothetical protein